ncbi:hypothetical protein Ciccas_013083 [Cichlidogyrus casuarinus]|uniref:Uncharacterized protein n=1 Tax=Cichlidogyrus casuarinus TaxID=1844966 RepID=A0ABD2PLI6_9PLAT
MKIASGERPLRISEYWYARLMTLYKELTGPPILRSARSMELINFYASEAEEMNSSPGVPTPTTLQFGATDKERVNSSKFKDRKNYNLESVNNYRYVYREPRNSMNSPNDRRNLVIQNGSNNLLKFTPTNKISQFLDWQQMERIQRYLASIEDAKRRKQMPKVQISPKDFASKVSLEATSTAYPCSSHAYWKRSCFSAGLNHAVLRQARAANDAKETQDNELARKGAIEAKDLLHFHIHTIQFLTYKSK